MTANNDIDDSNISYTYCALPGCMASYTSEVAPDDWALTDDYSGGAYCPRHTRTTPLSSSVISALKRLERAGSENSRATEKLIEAAGIVAEQIIAATPEPELQLPRGYHVEPLRVGERRGLFLSCGTQLVSSGVGYYPNPTGGFYIFIERTSREAALHFAADIASGLLDEIAAFLEQRAAEAASAAGTLEEKIK